MRHVARRTPRWAAVVALTVLLGLVGMHGLPMAMGSSTAAMTMPHACGAHPTSATVGGCGLDHGGCVTTLRDPDHLASAPAAVVLECDTPGTTTPARAARSDRAPPDRPDLTELCISRT